MALSKLSAMPAHRAASPPPLVPSETTLLLYTLYLGGCCVLKMVNDKSIHDMCRDHHVTWLELVTFTAQDCLRASQSLGPLPAFTRARLGGARVPIELRRDFTKMVCSQLHISYGATELAA